ncbi:hypothetical protein ACWFPY_05885 [Nocardia fluminea]
MITIEGLLDPAIPEREVAEQIIAIVKAGARRSFPRANPKLADDLSNR